MKIVFSVERSLCILVLHSSIFKGGHSYKFSKDSNVWIWYYHDPYPPLKATLTSQTVKFRPKATSLAAKQIDSLYLNSIYKTGTSLYVSHFNRFNFTFRIYIYLQRRVKQFKSKRGKKCWRANKTKKRKRQLTYFDRHLKKKVNQFTHLQNCFCGTISPLLSF